MKYQMNVHLENGGWLIKPPNPAFPLAEVPKIYQLDTKQLYDLSTKYRYNGKTFVYGRAVDVQAGGSHINAVLIASKGCMNSEPIKIGYSTAKIGTHVIGDEEITIEQAGITADEYKYGHMIIGHQTTTLVQNRGIIGNTASDSDGFATFTLDIPLSHATTHDTTAIEVWLCPYAELEWAGEDYQFASVMGIPMVNKVAPLDHQYFWLQTWGPCWVSPGAAALGQQASERDAVFDTQGQLAVPAAHANLQRAGYLIEKTKSVEDSVSAYDGEFIMLMLDP